MKTKILLFTVLLFLQGEILFSQCITVELSLTWEMKNDIFNKDSMVNTPILHITYHNNCEENYYFFNVSSKDAEQRVHSLALLQYDDDDYLKRAKNNLNYYTNYNFDVNIGGSHGDWWILCTKEDYNKHFGTHVSNSIHEIYDYLYSENYLTREETLLGYFVPSDITPENILEDTFIKDQFVFLKPNEMHVDTYNLIVYKAVGGCFTFLIERNTIENYVIVELGFKEDEEMELPEIVGEYHRYSGAFNTNKVTVCFGDR